ncbi:MAG: GMC family oxidoreductase [Geminicoccaceae bacterium]
MHANLVEVETGPDGAEVTGFKIATLDGKTGRVEARSFVLGLGGIENPRLLLNSVGTNPKGLGNDNDLVGRYFTDHMNGVVGQVAAVENDWTWAYNFLKSGDIRIRTKVQPTPKAQAERGLLNGAVQLGQKPTARDTSPGYKALRRIRDSVKKGDPFDGLGANVVAVATDVGGIWDGMVEYFVDDTVYIEVEAEQAPNPDSRVALSDELDPLGLRRVVFDWRLSEIDRHSIKGLVELVGEEVGRLGVGRAELAPWLLEGDDVWPEENFGGHHHSGTTRMATDSSKGVVDADCRVFGVDNFYIAGSSVFPTIGGSNPTLTIVALSLRLADHLKTSLAQT